MKTVGWSPINKGAHSSLRSNDGGIVVGHLGLGSNLAFHAVHLLASGPPLWYGGRDLGGVRPVSPPVTAPQIGPGVAHAL